MTAAARPATKMSGALRVARIAGIDVHVHWSWAVIGVVEIGSRSEAYTSVAWNVAEYLALFLIVLTHEFGHALACRSVGGTAENILLWPLGGVAFVQPPHRPGALLWSIAAGPLVNVVLLPVTIGLWLFASRAMPESNVEHFALSLAIVNAVVLAFNVLPIFPLDGGQILRALLWYFVGPHRSLLIAAGIGLVGAVAAFVLAIVGQDWWLGVLAFFGAGASWRNFQLARTRTLIDRALPRRQGFACPTCKEAPPITPAWACDGCHTTFDVFETAGRCPSCGLVKPVAGCVFCGAAPAVAAYGGPAPIHEPPPPAAAIPADAVNSPPDDAAPPAAPT